MFEMLRGLRNKYIGLIKKLNRTNNLIEENIKYSKEIIWANIYHDSIREKEFLKDVSLYPGRWAVNYSFLYVLIRILEDARPKKILEFGLGESSKIVSVFLQNELKNSRHVILEHNQEWINSFSQRFKLSSNSVVKKTELTKRNIKGFEVISYKDLNYQEMNDSEFYLVDGPYGSEHFSRYEIVEIAKGFNKNNKFIILIDDFNRNGEKESGEELKSVLTQNGCDIKYAIFSGEKDQLLITSKEYQFLCSV